MRTWNKELLEELSFHERLQHELSIYRERIIGKEGCVTHREISNPYFLINDSWNVDFVGSIPNLQNQFQKYTGTIKNVYFRVQSPPVNLEIKYIWYHKIFRDEWTLSSIFVSQNKNLRKLTAFLNEKYPKLSSLLDLNVESAEKEWVFWLEKNRVKTQEIQKRYYGEYVRKTSAAGFLQLMYSSLFRLTDNREEWEKDRWDIRNLHEKYGIKYNKSSGIYHIDFSKINRMPIRKQVKRYIKQRLLIKNNFSWSTAYIYMAFLPKFIEFILSIEPTWEDLKALKRIHIEQYIEWLHQYAKDNLKQKGSNPEKYIFSSLGTIHKFLEDIQQYKYDMAPEINAKLLVFPEDKPKLKRKSNNQVDHIPDYVLEQFFENISHLHREVQPVVWIAFKTGLRISDLLGLTQNCLVKLNGKYYIETDIEKTYVKGHRIPIDDELAHMIAVLIEQSQQNSIDSNNPEKYIFIRYSGSRKGKPYSQTWVQDRLNSYAKEQKITDENGDIFHFKMHQFRHTYAIKMLNSGADILTVQELLAHASPEMTMRYARLLDDTKRRTFENAVKQGVFSFDINGNVYEAQEDEDIPQDILETLWRDHKLTAIDNPYGSCRARLNGNCPYAEEPPCLTCNGGSPCKDLAVGLSDMDISKYEIHIQSTSKMIEVAKQYGRDEIAKKNKKNLERLQDIYGTIKQGNIIFGRIDRVKRKKDFSHG